VGVSTVFGLPGTQTVHLFDSMRRSGLRTVLATHELAASFMANGFARASGQPAVLATIPGPGFTYALTGLAEARHDSAPLLLLVTKSCPSPGRRFSLQVIDQPAMAKEVLKGAISVESAEAIPEAVAWAMELSLTGEPGPVMMEVMDSAIIENTDAKPLLAPLRLSHPRPAQSDLDRAFARIFGARRVVLLLGQGAADVAGSMEEVVEHVQAAVVTNCSGRGVLPEHHPRSVCGDFSGWASGLLNELITDADVVVALGCKLTHNGTSGFNLEIPREKLIHVDTSADVLDWNYPAAHALLMEVGEFVREFQVRLESADPGVSRWSAEEVSDWKTRFANLRENTSRHFPHLSGGKEGDLGDVFRRLRDHLPEDAIVVTDSGLHQTAVRHFYEVRSPRGLILPTDFQSMGFGLPAAIGAALAAPDRDVLAVIGDGGMAMTGLEVATAVREGLNLTVLIFNDGHLGLIRLQQLREYGHPHATKLGTMDFQALALGTGASYVAVDGGNLEVLEEGLRNPGVTVVDLLLSDSSAVTKSRSRALIRAGARTLLGDSGTRFLKGLAGKVRRGKG